MALEHSTFSMILCQLLTRGFEPKGMTQKQFLDTSGISQATWSRINRGLSPLTVEDLNAAAQTLDIELPALMKEAETVSKGLPDMEVEVVGLPKNPRGPQAKKESDKSDTGASSAIKIFLATAALAFLISRILKPK